MTSWESYKRVFKSPKASGALMAPKYDFSEENLRNGYFCLILDVFALPKLSKCLREGYVSTITQKQDIMSLDTFRCVRGVDASS